MLAHPPSSEQLRATQTPAVQVELLDAVYPVFEGGVGSGGLILEVVNPTPGVVWDARRALEAVPAHTHADAVLRESGTPVSFPDAQGHATTEGRTDQVCWYWAGGAPAHFGATANGQIALHVRGWLRPAAARAWFDPAEVPTWYLALAGQGYVRVDVCRAGEGNAPQTVFRGSLTEGDYLLSGYALSLPCQLAPGDQLDLYYVQDAHRDPWGGLVVKAVRGAPPRAADGTIDRGKAQAAAAAAPVLGCDLVDDGTLPEPVVLPRVESVEVSRAPREAATATVTLPLLNPMATDWVGYQHLREDVRRDAGVVVAFDGDPADPLAVVRRHRLVRITQGFRDAADPTAERYPAFFGLVHDLEPNPTDGTVAVVCRGFEHLLLTRLDRNYPDPISYMRCGFRSLGAAGGAGLGAASLPGTAVGGPVYGVAAFDAWPLEQAVAECMVRSGILASQLARALLAARADGTAAPVVFVRETADGTATEPVGRFAARTFSGRPVLVERQARYGNAGRAFTEQRAADDPYLFPPEPTQELWARVLTLTDKYGFDCWFDEEGAAVLAPRRNAHWVADVTAAHLRAGTGTLRTAPSAHGGTYLDITGPATVVVPVRGARIDVSLPRAPGLGAWRAQVVRVRDGRTMLAAPVIFDPRTDGTSGSAPVFFYDAAATTGGDGGVVNATLGTVFSGDFDEYELYLSPDGGGGTTRRLVDCVFAYHTDPDAVRFTLRTDVAAWTVRPTGSGADARNSVTAVGRRRAAVVASGALRGGTGATDGIVTTADGGALGGAGDPEFIVDRAVDVSAILNPHDPAFAGRPIEALLYDDTIADPAVATYVTRTFIYRYRVPAPGAAVEHPLLPCCQVRDAVRAAETVYQTLPDGAPLWVQRVAHRFEASGAAVTSLELTGMPEYPSFEPRDDIDIDAHFGGKPVVHVALAYETLSGHTVQNLPSTLPAVSDDRAVVQVDAPVRQEVDGRERLVLPPTAPWPPVPGTVFLRPTGAAVAEASQARRLDGDIWGFNGATLTRPDGAPQPVSWLSGPVVVAELPDARTVQAVKLRLYTRDASGAQRVTRELPVTASGASVNGVAVVKGWTLATAAGYTPRLGVELIVTPATARALWQQVSGVALVADWTAGTSGTAGANATWVTNTPYHHLFNVDSRDGVRALTLPWRQGDQLAAYRRDRSVTSYTVRYRHAGAVAPDGSAVPDPYAPTLGTRLGTAAPVSPFFDLTTPEVGAVMRVTFDALVSGFYRVAIRHAKTHEVVAWLTDAAADAADPEAHWTYLTAGSEKAFAWDGVDQVGTHNAHQSARWAQFATREDEANGQAATPVGRGFSCWNLEQDGADLGPLAVISAERDAATGEPVWGVGTFGAWYVTVEATNDTLQERARRASDPAQAVRTVRTLDAPPADVPVYAPSTLAPDVPATEAVFLTHLPPDATQLELDVADWTGAAQAARGLGTRYDPAGPTTAAEVADAGNWGPRDAEATCSNQKPVRVRFRVAGRKGPLWAGKEHLAQVKLLRHVHLKASVFDQAVVWTGGTYPKTLTPERVVTSRQLMNDDHTFTFPDAGFRAAGSFRTPERAVGLPGTDPAGATEWVFAPGDCRKHWRLAENEALRFGDYLQLEEVPRYDPTKAIAGARSRYQLGFLSYLFYLSAAVTDRAGRTCWGVNPHFLDRSKLTANAYGDWDAPGTPGTPATAATYRMARPADPMTQHRRTFVVRQWADEWVRSGGGLWERWEARERDRWGFGATPTGSVGAALLRHAWRDHEPTAAALRGKAWAAYALAADQKSDHLRTMGLLGTGSDPARTYPTDAITRQLGTATTTALGRWTWEGTPKWVPCVTRDFHPYFQLPPMADSGFGINGLSAHYAYGQVDGRADKARPGDAPETDDAAAGDAWSSWTRDMTIGWGLQRDWDGRFRGAGTKVVPNDKGDNVGEYDLDYVRQQDLVHWEHLRGLYSRGKRPAEAPIKVTPSAPYYVNLFAYATLSVGASRNKGAPLFRAKIARWFGFSFRAEYLYESGGFFPTDGAGVERLAAANAGLARADAGRLAGTTAYDWGAWTGWKDDLAPGSPLSAGVANVFASGYLPAAVGPALPETTDVLMHLALVEERRQAPVG